MTVVKARDLQKEQRGIVFNFKDIAAEGNAMLEAAKAESRRIIAEAEKKTRLESEKAYKEAYAKGYELGQKKGYDDAYAPAEKKGYDDGHTKALEEIKQRFALHIDEPLADTRKIIEYFESNKIRLLWQAEQSFVLLAVKLAEKIVRHKIELHPELVRDTVRAALETVARTTNVVIRVSPQDISIIEDLKGSLSDILGRFTSVSITPDESITPGGCIVQTERGKVDARIEKQIDRIARDILEPGATLEIDEKEEDSLIIDKLIEDSSQQQENLNPVVPAGETASQPQEAAVEDIAQEQIDDSTLADEVGQIESGEADPGDDSQDQPLDQAEILRRKMRQQTDQQDQS